jgi:DNA polymerase III epsilon subunit-like protein
MITVFDTETNGKADFKKPPEDACQTRLVQLAALLLDDDLQTIGELNVIIKPNGFVISDEVARIHGITQAKAEKHGIPEQVALYLFHEMLRLSKRIVAHNIKFDAIVIGRAFHVHQMTVTPPEPYCTMSAATNVCKLPGGYGGAYKWPTLQEAHQALLGVSFDGAHDAMADVKACARIYEHLIHGDRPKARPVEPPLAQQSKNVPDLREYNDSTPMPFGKYRGTPLSKLPESYCKWLYEQEKLSDELLAKWLHGDKTCLD